MNKWAEWSKRSKAQGKFDWFTNDLFLCFIKDANVAAWPEGNEAEQGLFYWNSVVLPVLDARRERETARMEIFAGLPLRCAGCGLSRLRASFPKTHCGEKLIHKSKFALLPSQQIPKSPLETFYETTWGTQS